MKELSLNILDIAGNSVKANAKNICISIDEKGRTFELRITDDGCGMSEEMVKNVVDPFCTTRTTRNVGLGVPFLKLAAEQTRGHIEIKSRHESQYPDSHGTEVYALFYRDSVNFVPLGDIVSTLTALICGSPQTEFRFEHRNDCHLVTLDTRELRAVLGEDVPLSSPEVINWITEYLKEQYANPQ